MRLTICARIGKCLRVVNTSDVIRFTAEEKYITAYTSSLSICFEGTLCELEDEFSAEFVRIHRSHLVRKSKIIDIKWSRYKASVALEGSSQRVAVSRQHVAQIRLLIASLLAEGTEVQKIGLLASYKIVLMEASNENKIYSPLIEVE